MKFNIFLHYFLEYVIIKNSGLFNKDFYLNNYNSSYLIKFSPLLHYIIYGWKLGKNPSSNFDTRFYLKRNPDVLKNNVNPLFHYIRHGLKEGRRPKSSQKLSYLRYMSWVKSYDTLSEKDKQLITSAISDFALNPLITIFIVADNNKAGPLQKSISSLQKQIYKNWEAYILFSTDKKLRLYEKTQKNVAQDPRLKIVNGSSDEILSRVLNETLKNCNGDFLCTIDSGVVLPQHALYMIANEINNYPDAQIIYSDEDQINESGIRKDPYYKPDWNPDLFRSQYYFNNISLFPVEKVKKVGGFRPQFGEYIFWDLFLRLTEITNLDQIRHIPFVLSHELAAGPGTKNILDSESNPDFYQDMIRSHFERTGKRAQIAQHENGYQQILYAIPEPQPRLSVIIPTKNGHKMLSVCLESILNKGGYDNLEIIIVDNESRDPETLNYFEKLKNEDLFTILKYNHPFNYSAINNFAAHHSSGEVLLFLNNDIEALSHSWIMNIVRHAVRPDIGAVGAMLYYPDKTIQHAGIILGDEGVAGHAYVNELCGYRGQKGRAKFVQNYSAVTGACLAVEKRKFLGVGGFEEKHLPIAYNDVDLCLKLLQAGYRNLWTPFVELIHHESATRGFDITSEKKTRLDNERSYMINTWHSILYDDPAYNLNLSLSRPDFSLAFPPRTSKPWIK